jgi:hypothetical protein
VLCCGVGWTHRSGRPLSGGVLVSKGSLVTPEAVVRRSCFRVETRPRSETPSSHQGHGRVRTGVIDSIRQLSETDGPSNLFTLKDL